MVTLLPADALAGKLQRGLGGGYLEALASPRAEVEASVLGFIANDPRASAQDESRDRYYARLLLKLDSNEESVADILRRNPDADTATTRDWLPVGVLGVFARSGRGGAVRALREYVGTGAWWTEALFHLAQAGDPAVFEGLDAVLAARFATDPAEIASMAYARDEAPWRWWRDTGPLAALLSEPEERLAEPVADLRSLETAALLARVSAPAGRLVDAVADILADRVRTSAADRTVVEAALRGTDLELVARAVRVLGQLGDPAIVEPGERVLAAIGPRFGAPGSHLRTAVLRGFEGLGPDAALPVARAWRDASDYRWTVAMTLLDRHAGREDLPWVLESLGRAAAAGDDIYFYARILRRFPGEGPFDGLNAIARSYAPSCCRAQLFDALSIADPTFGDTLAYEALFDCEALAREAGARLVTRSSAADEALVELAYDSSEEDEVRWAAGTRLGPEELGRSRGVGDDRRAYDRQLAGRGARLAWRVDEPVPYCWMCDATSGRRAREHVFPQWLLATLDAAGELFNPVHRDYLGRVISTRGPIPASALVAGEVCESCNGGWMSQLESSLRPLLFPADSRRPLSEHEQATVARWFAKTAVVLNTSQNYRLMIPRDARHGLATGMPPDFRVYLAKYRHPDGGKLMFGQTTGAITVGASDRLDEMRVRLDRVYACGLAVGDLLGVVVYAPPGAWASPTEPMVRIWPSPGVLDWAALPSVDDMQGAMILGGEGPGPDSDGGSSA